MGDIFINCSDSVVAGAFDLLVSGISDGQAAASGMRSVFGSGSRRVFRRVLSKSIQ